MGKHKLYIYVEGKVKYTIYIDKLSTKPEELKIFINGKVRKCIKKNITGQYKLRYGNQSFDIGRIIYLTLNNLTWEDGLGKSIKYINGNVADLSKDNLELVNKTWKRKYDKVIMKPDCIEFSSIADAAEWLQKHTDTKATRKTLQTQISKHIKKMPDKAGRTIKTIFTKTFELIGK